MKTLAIILVLFVGGLLACNEEALDHGAFLDAFVAGDRSIDSPVSDMTVASPGEISGACIETAQVVEGRRTGCESHAVTGSWIAFFVLPL